MSISPQKPTSPGSKARRRNQGRGHPTRRRNQGRGHPTRRRNQGRGHPTRRRNHPARWHSQGRDGRTQNRIAQGTEPQPLHHYRSRCGGSGAGQIPAVNRPSPPPDTPDLTLYPYTRKILEVLEVLDTEQPTVETHRMDSLMRVRIDDTKALVHHGHPSARDHSPRQPRGGFESRRNHDKLPVDHPRVRPSSGVLCR